MMFLCSVASELSNYDSCQSVHFCVLIQSSFRLVMCRTQVALALRKHRRPGLQLPDQLLSWCHYIVVDNSFVCHRVEQLAKVSDHV